MNTTSGQHAPLIIDIAGLTLTKTDRQRLKHPLTAVSYTHLTLPT